MRSVLLLVSVLTLAACAAATPAPPQTPTIRFSDGTTTITKTSAADMNDYWRYRYSVSRKGQAGDVFLDVVKGSRTLNPDRLVVTAEDAAAEFHRRFTAAPNANVETVQSVAGAVYMLFGDAPNGLHCAWMFQEIDAQRTWTGLLCGGASAELRASAQELAASLRL